MTHLPSPLVTSAERLLRVCAKAGLMVATAESCTGGLIAAALTAVAGSSRVFERGFVTYSNAAKFEMLRVPLDLIAEHGAVSEAVARAMAMGALTASPADIAISVTGIAGPEGGTVDKPVGLVHMAAARRGRAILHCRHVFAGDRTAVREATVIESLTLAIQLVETPRS
ncbi:MAG: CinA family protein [Alphaproteobacteria bacterium]|nr:CinA family protein [Alphaproteobacteria bacterium]